MSAPDDDKWWDDPADLYSQAEKDLANLEPAWAKAALQFRTDRSFGHREGEERGKSLLQIHRMLEGRRKRFESTGAAIELHLAVAVCAEENLPLPTWLALNERIAKPMLAGTPQEEHLANRDLQIAGKLWGAVWRVAENHKGLSPALDEVLRDGAYPFSKSKARRLVKVIDRNQSEFFGQSLSQFWPKLGKR